MRGLFGGRQRSGTWHGKELGRYRNELHERTQRIDTRLAEVAEEMCERYVRHVLVEEDGRLVGIVSARDLLGVYAAAEVELES